MEQNEIMVVTGDVSLDVEQYEELRAEIQQVNSNLQTLNASIGHATSFLILLCILKLYGLLRRTTKKGGV